MGWNSLKKGNLLKPVTQRPPKPQITAPSTEVDEDDRQAITISPSPTQVQLSNMIRGIKAKTAAKVFDSTWSLP